VLPALFLLSLDPCPFEILEETLSWVQLIEQSLSEITDQIELHSSTEQEANNDLFLLIFTSD
jgi:hypothetical protein